LDLLSLKKHRKYSLILAFLLLFPYLLVNTFEIKQILNKKEILFSLKPYNNIGILLYNINIKNRIGEITLKPFTRVLIIGDRIQIDLRLGKSKNIHAKIIIKEMEIENINTIIIGKDDLSLYFSAQEFNIDGKRFNSSMLKYNEKTKELKIYEYIINRYPNIHEYVL
jgi:hypothetical protein